MKTLFAGLFVLFFAVNTSVKAQDEEQLQVVIHYNSLSTDMYRFMIDQLLPAWELIRDVVDVSFIPFGRSFFVDHGGWFLCQFGPEDCYGNMLQLCALQQICRDQEAQVDFVACEMNYPFDRNVTRPQCAEQVGVNWDDVEWCINSGLGRELKIDAERRTHTIARPYPGIMPAISYNGVFNVTLSNRSLNEFFYVVCELTGLDHEWCPE